MKLTKSHLKQLIKEEADEAQNEGLFDFFKSKKKPEKPAAPPAPDPEPEPEKPKMPSLEEQEDVFYQTLTDLHYSWDSSEFKDKLSKTEFGGTMLQAIFRASNWATESRIATKKNLEVWLLAALGKNSVEGLTSQDLKRLKMLDKDMSLARRKDFVPARKPYEYNPNAPKNVVGPDQGYIGPTGKPGLPMYEKRNISRSRLRKIIHEEIKKALNGKKKVINEKTYIDKSGYIFIDGHELANLATSGQKSIEIDAQDYTKAEYGAKITPGIATLSLTVTTGLPPKQTRGVTMTGNGEIVLKPEQLGKPFNIPGTGGTYSFAVNNLEQLAEEYGWNIK